MVHIRKRVKSINKQHKFIFLFFLSLPLLASFFYYRYVRSRAAQYFINSSDGGGSVRKISLSPRGTPKETQPSYFVEAWEMDVVSTGVIRDYDMKDEVTKKNIGKARVIEVLAKAEDGKIKRLNFVIEFSSAGSSERGLQPKEWAFWKNAAIKSGWDLSSQAGHESGGDELNSLFAEGTSWVFSPLLEPDSEFNKEIFDEQYLSYAKMYYGEKISELRKFLESGLTTRYSGFPIFLAALN